MVNGRQIRAARALIDMSQDELAEQAGLTPQAIRKIEAGTVTPREGTISDMVKVFYENNVEFIDNGGVRFIPEDVKVLNGESGMEHFWNQVYETMKISGGTIRQNGIPEEPLDKCAPKAAANHRERMAPLVRNNGNIFVKALIPEGDMNFLCTNYADYKWHPNSAPPPVPYYVFGDNVAIFTFEADPSPKVILIKSQTIAKAYREQFDSSWALAISPPKDS